MKRHLEHELRNWVRSAVSCTLISIICGCSAMASVQFSEVGRWGDRCLTAAVSGNRAYVAMGPSVEIFDISIPGVRNKMGTLRLPTTGSVNSIEISGGYAYITAYQSGLLVADISEPSSPSIVGSCPTSDYSNDVAVAGSYAYVSDWNNGLKIIDIADPAHPTQVGQYTISGYCYAVAVLDHYAYLTDNSGLLVIDVANPAAPVKAGVLSGIFARDIAIVGERLYTASGFTNGFQVFDISSRTAPVRLGFVDTPGEALGVAVSGDYAYIGDSLSGVQVVSIIDRAHPTIVSTYDTVGSAGRLVACDDVALVSDGQNGMVAIDVSNPASPVAAWASPSGTVSGVALAGNTAYVACLLNDSGNACALKVLDVSDPNDVRQIGSCTIPSAGTVKLSGNLAWICGYAGGVHIVDVSSPTNPTKLATFDTPGTARDVALFSHYACVADYEYGIHVLDIANPASPVRVGGYDTNGYSYAVEVSGEHVYVADEDKGLKVISLADPAAPALVGTYQTSGNASDIEISGSFLYLAAAGFQVLDIANPTTPQLLGGQGYVSTSSMTLSGNCIYTSAGNYVTGLGAMFDVSDPANPLLVGRGTLGGNICTVSDRVYSVPRDSLSIMLASQSAGCIVSGYVRDSAGNPVYGVTVSTIPGDYTATTDWKGHYELDYIDSGTYTIAASGSGWALASTTVDLPSGATVQASDIVLEFGQISGCITDDLGSPVGGATVSYDGAHSYTADANGIYTISDLTPGIYYLTASKPEHVSVSQSVSVSGGQTLAQDFTLVRTGSVTGYVRDTLGDPVSGISITTSPFIGHGIGSNSDGSYLLTDVPAGTYSVIASDPSWTSVTIPGVVITPGSTVTLDFTLQLGAISGLVNDSIGNPVPGAVVSTSDGSLYATTGADGTYIMPYVRPTYDSSDLGPAYYSLTAKKTGYTSSTQTARVKSGQTTNVNFSLTAYATVSGYVRDSNGWPVTAAQVNAYVGSCVGASTTTDSSGAYSLPNVLPGDYRLIASQAGYGTTLHKFTLAAGQAVVCDFRLAGAVALDVVSTTSIGSRLDGIAVADGLAATIKSGYELSMINISDPAGPVKLSTFSGVTARDVALSGNYVYLAGDSAGLQILDVSNPSAPSLVGSYDTTGTARGVDIVGSYAYVADGSAGLQVINISNPRSPVRVGGYYPCGNPTAIDVANGYAYLAAGTGGLRVINVVNPTYPQHAAIYSPVDCNFFDVTVSGHYAYIADGSSNALYVVDVAIPTSPTLVGMGYAPSTSYSWSWKMFAQGNYLYVAGGYYIGTMIYDITTPTDPALVAHYPQYRADDVAASNGYLYLAEYAGTLRVLTQYNFRLTGVAPQQVSNVEGPVSLSLTGLGFTTGSAVKLSHEGQADIPATEVVITDPTRATCTFNLAGATPGVWDVTLTRANGSSSSLPDSLVIVMPDSAPCVAATNRSVQAAIATAAGRRWQFRLFGVVTEAAQDSFWITDGSGAPIKVYAPDYNRTRIVVGRYVAVTGTLDLSTGSAVMMSRDSRIDSIQ